MDNLNRRAVVGAGLALASTPAFAKDPRVSFAVPDGACDSHHHIYDPRFAYQPNAVLKPPYATVADYRALQKKIGTSRNVMVQPSTYGTDNSCLLDVLAQMGDNARAVCVVNSSVTDAELKKLHAAGTRGVRIQFGLGNPVAAEEVMPRPERLVASNRYGVLVAAVWQRNPRCVLDASVGAILRESSGDTAGGDE